MHMASDTRGPGHRDRSVARRLPSLRSVALGVAASVVGSLLVALATASSVGAQPTSAFCADGRPAPCVVSATLDGGPVDSAHPDFDILVTDRSVAGATGFFWAVTTTDGGFDLGPAALGDEWVITFRTGPVDPRFVSTHGRPGSVVRTADTVTIAASTVVITNGCNPSVWPWVCPTAAETDWDALLDGEVTDFGQWTDASQRESFRGYDLFSNIDTTSAPVEIANGPDGAPRLLIRMANSHFRVDGVTPVSGFMRQRIPASFLDEVYGIDDPGSLTSGGVAATLTGRGSGTVTVSVVGDAVVVEATGLTFSQRVVRIDAGEITPRRPRGVVADRVDDTRARLTYQAGRARGSSVRRHVAVCSAVGGDDTVRGVARRGRPIVVRGLAENTEYRCRVRAIADAGPSPWSRPARLAATTS